jgi:hypothetical protein
MLIAPTVDDDRAARALVRGIGLSFRLLFLRFEVLH